MSAFSIPSNREISSTVFRPWKVRQIDLRTSIGRARSERAIFQRIHSIDSRDKARLFPTVRRAINRLCSRKQAISESVVLSVLMVAIIFGGGYLAAAWFADSDVMTPFWLAAIGGVLSFCLLFTLPRKVPPAGSLGTLPTPLLAYPTVVVLFIAAQVLQRTTRQAWLGPANALLGGAAFVGEVFVIMFLALLPSILVNAGRLRRHSDAIILTRLIRLLDDIERGRQHWSELPFKAAVNRELDSIANIVQHDLAYQYRSKDFDFSVWFNDRCWRIAAFLRGLKKWTSMSRENTYPCFTKELAGIIVSIASDDWDGVPCIEGSPPTLRERGLRRAISLARNMAATFAPLVVLAIGSRLKIRLPDGVAPYLYLAVIVWTVLGIVALLDPLYSSRLEAVKTAIQLLPAIGKKKE